MSLADDNLPDKAEAGWQAWKELQQEWPASLEVSTETELQQEWPASLEVSTERESEAWVRWEYSAKEWALFDRIDWGWRGIFFRVLLAGNIVFLLGAILPWFFLHANPNLVATTYSADMALLLSFFFCALFYGPAYTAARKRHKARQNLPRTVTFSKKGVWVAGTFFPINERYEVTLKEVRLTPEPPVLHFRLKRSAGDSYMNPTLRVLVPREQTGEARPLLKRFQTEVIAARKAEEERARQEEERRKHPPEPR